MLRNTLNTFITATLIMLLGVSSSASAQTIVPAGNLMGTTSVTWGAGTAEETASEIQHSIQSILVPAAPILSEPDNQTRIPADEPSVTLEYTITSNANGEDKYSLSLAVDSVGVAGAGSPALSKDEVTLGATAAMKSAAVGAIEVEVPSDGVPDDVVNGITNGDTVIINDNAYTVGVVVDDGNTAKIPLTPPLIGPVAFGDRIAQQETFEVTLDNVGTIAEGVDTSTVTITVTATSKSPGVPPADDDVVLTLLTPVGPSVEKYVRNVTPENDRNPPEDNLETWVDQGFAYEYPAADGTFYFRSQLNDGARKDEALVKAEEDDTLEYLIVLKAGNQEDQTGIILNETLSPFTAYLPGYAKINNEEAKLEEQQFPVDQTERASLTDNEGEPLIIAKNTSAHLTYQVKVIGGDGDDDGGDGGDGQWATNDTDCSYNKDTGLWKPDSDNDATKCKGVKWNAANGPRNPDGSGPMLEHNPVCWDTKTYGSGWQVDGKNPWVVGTAADIAIRGGAYGCRTKCADKSGESFGHCAADGWWDNDAASSTFTNADGGQICGISSRRGRRVVGAQAQCL